MSRHEPHDSSNKKLKCRCPTVYLNFGYFTCVHLLSLVYKLLVEFEQQLIFKVSRVHPGSLCSEQQWVARRRPRQVGQYWVSGTVFWYSERRSADPYWLRHRLGTLLTPLYLLTFWTSLRKINHLHLMNVVRLAPASNIWSRCCLT